MNWEYCTDPFAERNSRSGILVRLISVGMGVLAATSVSVLGFGLLEPQSADIAEDERPVETAQGASAAETASTSNLAYEDRVVAYLQNLPLGGVVNQGQQIKALVDGQLVSPGEVVAHELGIRFLSITEDRQNALFEDLTGRRYQKHF
ncbi:MAG: hypothetical protein ACFB21_06515 [Opitutales bacterium]